MDITSYLLGKQSSGGGGGSSDLDWSAIGYSKRPESIDDGYDYAKQIQQNWTPSTTNLSYKFDSDYNLKFMPLVDTSNATNMQNMFNKCYFLEKVPIFNMNNVINATGMFTSCNRLVTAPLLDLSNVRQVTSLFSGCQYLKNVPQFNFKSTESLYNIFIGCPRLTDDSLNNILLSCINATNVIENKTLYYLGLRSSDYSVSKIQALPAYQDFIDAGWTIGY